MPPGHELQIGVVEPVSHQRLQMLLATDAPHSSLSRQHGMPGEDSHTVEPAILHYQKPPGMALGLNATNDT